SHQIRALEKALGTQLFERNGKRIAITAAGQRFATIVRNGLNEIAQGAAALRDEGAGKRLRISALPSFASRWLAPRLWKFIDLHPDIDVTLESSEHLKDLFRDPVDVGLRFGGGNYPGLHAVKLMDDYFYPVASPRYRNGRLPKTPAELADCTLLRMDTGESWQPWLDAAGLSMQEPQRGLQVYDASMVLRGVVEGAGVALTRHAIAVQELASGDAVRLFDIAVRASLSYYFVCRPDRLDTPLVQEFLHWLQDEVQLFEASANWPASAARHQAVAG
ncbi:MAG: LysR substrate-binding domain-containing protein, partial [Janthinobacterium lividum]